MCKVIQFMCGFLLLIAGNCYADDGFFYVNILPPSGSKAVNGNSVIIDYKICNYENNKPTNCVLSQASVGGRVGQSYGIIQTLQPSQRVSAFEASLFVPNQQYPLFIQSFPILEDGTTSCTNQPDKNYITFYADAMGMRIICQP